MDKRRAANGGDVRSLADVGFAVGDCTYEEQRRDDSHGSVVTEDLEDENFRLMDMDHNEDVNSLKQSMKNTVLLRMRRLVKSNLNDTRDELMKNIGCTRKKGKHG